MEWVPPLPLVLFCHSCHSYTPSNPYIDPDPNSNLFLVHHPSPLPLVIHHLPSSTHHTLFHPPLQHPSCPPPHTPSLPLPPPPPVLLIHGRYQLLETVPIHTSPSCLVFKAKDVLEKETSGEDKFVAIKVCMPRSLSHSDLFLTLIYFSYNH